MTGGALPIEATDALVTGTKDLPLMMMYADCVPVVLVAKGPRRAVGVVHAGWRGALSRLPAKAASRGRAGAAGCRASDLELQRRAAHLRELLRGGRRPGLRVRDRVSKRFTFC